MKLEEPKFVQGVPGQCPRLGKALEALIEDLVNVESGKSMAFLEGFLQCRFQLEVSTPL